MRVAHGTSGNTQTVKPECCNGLELLAGRHQQDLEFCDPADILILEPSLRVLLGNDRSHTRQGLANH